MTEIRKSLAQHLAGLKFAPLGLCGRCCQAYAAGVTDELPEIAVAVLPSVMTFGPQQVVVPLPTGADCIAADAEQAKAAGQNGPKRPFLIARPGDQVPPGWPGG